MSGDRFSEGDILEVRDKDSGTLLAVGKALQDRNFIGLSHFEVMKEGGGIYGFNLNQVDTEIIFSATQPEPRTLTIDLATGKWLKSPDGGINGDEGYRVAASVLPGISAEEVSKFYAEKLLD